MGKAPARLSPPSHQGEPSSRGTPSAPGRLPSLGPGMPTGLPPPVRIPSAVGLCQWKLQANQAGALWLRGPQQLQEPDPQATPGGGAWRSPSPPAGNGRPTRWEPPRGPYATALPQEQPAGQTGHQWLGPSSLLPLPLSQQPKEVGSSGRDFPLAQWGSLPGGIFSRSERLSRGRGAPPVLHLPSKVCILTLAMMIAGIPTVPVPGIREEDMIRAAHCFVAGNLEPRGVDGGPRRRWAAVQHSEPSCKRDRQRKRAASRSLLPPFLTPLEK
ncbi:hypothetical protein JRQ81_014475 [Phrynocephalus forsythii]|uniref:Uncharacterized protein n=1 Tax=Phrynocephalus forsythii TaxID=171643 RepID=A0A9Q1B3J8_9SAUR|nr:hypothetical protein JRQ81_014475 [Phrynocephalus forsythii]